MRCLWVKGVRLCGRTDRLSQNLPRLSAGQYFRSVCRRLNHLNRDGHVVLNGHWDRNHWTGLFGGRGDGGGWGWGGGGGMETITLRASRLSGTSFRLQRPKDYVVNQCLPGVWETIWPIRYTVTATRTIPALINIGQRWEPRKESWLKQIRTEVRLPA